MKWLVGAILSVTLTGPTVREITMPGGGYVLSWTDDLSCCIGSSRDGVPFIWTEETGPLLLTHVANGWPSGFQDWPRPQLTTQSLEYMLRFVAAPDGHWHSYLVRLPRDLRTLFSPADFDFDGDVDQQDFGYLQRLLGTPECPMTLEQFEAHRTGPGVPYR